MISALLGYPIKLIIVIMGLTIALSFFSAFSSGDQIAEASAHSLRTAFNTACELGRSKVTINLPQDSPPSVRGIFEVAVKTRLKLDGGPKYLLYYESFPPGEAVSWELYLNLDKRKVMEANSNNINKFKNRENRNWVASNIILGSLENGAEDLDEPRLYGDVGVWKDKYYSFINYFSLSDLEKTLIKYRPCGENALCFKTVGGVEKLPLTHCENLKSIRMIYDEGMWWNKCQGGGCPDFHLASPCKAEFEIKRVPCAGFSDSEANCDKAVSNPLHELDNEELKELRKENAGTVQCLDRLYNPTGKGGYLGNGYCLEVRFLSGNGFCSTSNNKLGGGIIGLLGETIKYWAEGDVEDTRLVTRSAQYSFSGANQAGMTILRDTEWLPINNLRWWEEAVYDFVDSSVWPHSRIAEEGKEE